MGIVISDQPAVDPWASVAIISPTRRAYGVDNDMWTNEAYRALYVIMLFLL